MLLFVLALGCKPKPDISDPPSGSAASTRRLSVVEIQNSLRDITGVDLSDVALPPDATDNGYDRVADSQTISSLHLESYEALADALAIRLLQDGGLDAFSDRCPDAILPPPVASTSHTLPASGFSGSPSWAMKVEDGHLYFLYSESVTVSTTVTVDAAGPYHFSMPVEFSDRATGFPQVQLSVDGVVVQTWSDLNASATLETDLELAEGSVAISLDFAPGDTWWSQWPILIYDATLAGPVDPGATTDAQARADCVADLVPALGARLWRRPLSTAEVSRLKAVWDAGNEEGSAGEALSMVIQALVLSPHFLYLVEVGSPVDGRPGWYALNDWEQAARLSYTWCETAPDVELRRAAENGELRTADQVEAQARRLLESDCGHTLVKRFHRQWLKLGALDSMARDPVYYPEFVAGMGTPMREDLEYYFEQMVYGADLAETWSSSRAWVGPQTASLVGATANAEHTEIQLPEDRLGPLTSPALLAANAKFSETSPVLRGAFVLRQLLCADLPPPPSNIAITPPELRDDMTTRERWEAHSKDPACSGCHTRMDPIGFALEGYDALGRSRGSENGLPIDTSGSVPDLGEKAVSGGVELAETLANSDALRHCFARQWLRYGMGQLEDEEANQELLASMEGGATVEESMLALSASERFRHRLVAKELP